MKFYTNVQQWGNKLLVRGVNNGTPYLTKVDYLPTLYLKSSSDSEIKSMFGENLKPISFDNIKEAKAFVESREGIEDSPIFGNTGYAYQYIHEKWGKQIEFDQATMCIRTIDIETSSELGFPEKSNPLEEILLVTFQDLATKERWTFGSRPFDLKNAKHLKNKEKIKYILCRDERDLIERVLRFWAANPPDIITGWNIVMFDIPYFIARTIRVLGEASTRALSPWNEVRPKMVKGFGNEEVLTYDILGVSQLDYLDLFKKFANMKPENYKLDTVAEEVLGRKKLEHPYETFKEFYTKDWQLFVEYNNVDVELVDEMDDQLQLISLALTMAYDAKCNFSDVFAPTKLWDCLIFNYLASRNIQVHQRQGDREKRRIKGGYVSEVKPQKYEWVVSFDATSLYPSIIMQYNMSPEKLVEGLAFDTTVDGLLNDEYDLSALKDRNVAMTANGYCFQRDNQGVFPEIVTRLFKERVEYKKLMQKAEKEYEKTKDPIAKKAVSKYDNFQQARKILLNSLFGAMANEYFRYFDIRIAEGITLTGQYIIQRISIALNEYLNKVCKTSGFNYSFYSDTDSCYVTLAPLVEKLYSHLPPEKIVGILDKICKEQLNSVLETTAKAIADDTNGFHQTIYFKREAIADHAIFLGKKHYALNVWDNEGLRYTTPKQKVKGLELVKSSTPKVVRAALKDALKICLTGTQKQLHTYMDEFEKTYSTYDVKQIASPRGVNGLSKYEHSVTIYGKGCPMHVRGALLYNFYIKQKKLDKQFPLIQEGEKIRFAYLKEPNPMGENTIAFIGSLPKGLGLHTYIDYVTMFEKTMVEPVNTITQALGWTTRPAATLEGLFND